MTEADIEQQQARRKATIEAQKKKQKELAEKDRPAADFFRRPSAQQPLTTTGDKSNNSSSYNNNRDNSVANDEDRTTVNEEGREQNGDEQHNNEQHNINHSDEQDHEVITINSSSPRFITPEDAAATLDIDDDEDDCEEDDDDDDDDDDDGNNNKQQSKEEGVMNEVLRAVQQRIKYEESKKFPALQKKWMLEYLKDRHWSIPRLDIPMIVRKLGLQHDRELFKHYYTRLDVWLPDLQYGCMPCCPNCKHNHAVGVHAYPSHPGRTVVNQTDNYRILTRRYICHDCKKEKERLKAIAKNAATAAANVEVEVAEVKLQTTFLGWDRRILPLFPDGIGREFPAFLTKRSGFDNSLIDLMRPLMNRAFRPEAFSELLLELHTKEWTKRYIRYERDVERKDRLAPGFAKTAPLFSDFGDKNFYDGKVPTGKFVKHVYNLYHDTISEHLAKEVKKRPTKMLYWDVSYKTAKKSNLHNGEQIFKGLVTGMNELGEVRIQFHIHTDSQDQMMGALQAFKATNNVLGMEDPKYFVTDNPTADAAFITAIFDSLKQQQQQLNNHHADTTQIQSLDDYSNDNVKVLSTAQEVNIAITAMWDVAKTKVIGLDAEWSVTMNRYGQPTEIGKVALIQISYIDEDNNITTLLVRTNKMAKLPHRLESLLTGSTFRIVGVNVSGDLIKIGSDFDIDEIKQNKRQKDRSNVTNLGSFARARDIVQSGNVSLQQLCEVVLKARLDKATNTRLSCWDQDRLTDDQVRYAALDAIASLKIFLKLDEMPDLTRRYTMGDVSIGDKVDLVPMHGSVSCMATRAATGIIVNVDRCESPNDVTPRVAKAGNETVAIKLVTIYSTGFKIPSYTYKPSGSRASPATLSCFDEGCNIVVPVHMLKHHVNSDHVRSTPADASLPSSISNVTAPAQDEVAPAQDEIADTEEEAVDDPDEDDDDDDDFGEDVRRNSLTEATKSTHDIELIRAAAEQSESSQSVVNLFPCKGLSASPSPTAILDVFSSVLGDAFHAMKRHITPMHHEGKKAFFVALREAFLMWNKEKLEVLKGHLRKDGMSEEEIEKKMIFTSTLFTDCVDRYIPPPSLLYFRVRAVFVLFGHLKDSKTKKPLFNAKVWKCANNVLDEILLGYYSDPPGVQWYTKRLKKNGSVATNKYGMELFDCSRGTNRVESFHKDLITTWGSWPMGIEMSVKVLAEKRHRHNHRVSEKRRDGFPKIGHYDTWDIDELQLLVSRNRGFILFPHWSNSSEYVSTEESFDVVALQSDDVQQALEARCEVIAPLPKLTRELQFQCNAMGTPLPFLPFSTAEEKMKFSEYVHSLSSPLSANDDKKAAVDWCFFVDGLKIMPKLPCHFRTYRRKWEKNQRSKDLFNRSKSGRQKLAELNSIEQAVTADAPNQPIPLPPPMPQPQPGAMHNQPFTIVANNAIGQVPLFSTRKRKHGQRGKDREGTTRQPRRCLLCMEKNGPHFGTCAGRWPRGKCQYFST